MATQLEKGKLFHALHRGPGAFLMPNPWDIGTARLLTDLGFDALATTSAGFCFSGGRPDYTFDRASMMDHAAAIVVATRLPVSGDLENGFGDSPGMVAETIRLAAAAGLVGGSIEDATGRDGEPIYEIGFAAERMLAAADAAHSVSFPFTLTGRAENYLHGKPDLSDTIQRLQAYQEAGADVLYAPGLRTLEEITSVVRSVDRPVNVLAGSQAIPLDMAMLSALGVKRVSLGSLLARTALGAFLRAAREMQKYGTFSFAEQAVSSREINDLLAPTSSAGRG